MAWDLDPYNLGANNFTPFSQSEWMSKNAGILGTTPMTKAGVCMALTANLFKYYRKNGHYDGYFSWLGGSEAMSEIEKFQTDYMKSATGASDPNVAPAMSISNLLNAFRRTTEDEVFTSMQFGSVDSPATPSFFAVRFFSTFAGQVTAKSGSQSCLYKPIYASGTGGAHNMGAILDYGRGVHIFFDANNGLVDFMLDSMLSKFLKEVEGEYGNDYIGYFVDTKA